MTLTRYDTIVLNTGRHPHVSLIQGAVTLYSRKGGLPGELDLHHLIVDEALSELDRYLYDAYAAGMPLIRVIHGKGTGTLRLAVRKHLHKHDMVKSFRPANQFEGGDGATVVELRD